MSSTETRSNVTKATRNSRDIDSQWLCSEDLHDVSILKRASASSPHATPPGVPAVLLIDSSSPVSIRSHSRRQTRSAFTRHHRDGLAQNCFTPSSSIMCGSVSYLDPCEGLTGSSHLDSAQACSKAHGHHTGQVIMLSCLISRVDFSDQKITNILGTQ